MAAGKRGEQSLAIPHGQYRRGAGIQQQLVRLCPKSAPLRHLAQAAPVSHSHPALAGTGFISISKTKHIIANSIDSHLEYASPILQATPRMVHMPADSASAHH